MRFIGTFIDLTGQRFGRLFVVERVANKHKPCGQQSTMWKCRCDCGNEVEVSTSGLRHGGTRSCGCLQKEIASKKHKGFATIPFADLSGQKFGRLTVICRDIEYTDSSGASRYKYKCLCDCGNYTWATPYQLKSGGVRSCGCLHKESASNRGKANTRHGGNRRNAPYEEKRLYHIWSGMKQRCENPNNGSYSNYGGRGIKICEEWNDFANFQKWSLDNGYSDDLSIDRIDYNGNYEPNNCRWATKIEQANNTRANRFVDIGGVSHTVADWSRISGVKAATILARLEYGWKPEDAVYKS